MSILLYNTSIPYIYMPAMGKFWAMLCDAGILSDEKIGKNYREAEQATRKF